MFKQHQRTSIDDVLTATSAAAAGAAFFQQLQAAERPPVTRLDQRRRHAVEPKWDERLTITVGPTGRPGWRRRPGDAGAVDTLRRLAGGTVRVLPGLIGCEMRSTWRRRSTFWARGTTVF